MKREQDMLKSICDTIDYEINMKGLFVKDGNLYKDVGIGEIYINVREIIFTPEFMEKYWQYYKLNKFSSESIYETMQLVLIQEHLQDPTTYLYNLIK